MQPTHSVIMAVLNGRKYIAGALNSALPQLGPDDEILVIDNGSTDDTVALVEAIGDPRIHLLHEATRGPAAARNRGLRVARGEFISFLDHDDYWDPGRLAAMTDLLRAHPGADVVAGLLHMVFDGVRPVAKYVAMEGSRAGVAVMGVQLFRADAIRKTGLMDETLQFGEDSDFMMRFRAVSRGVVQWDGVALTYRRHNTNMTNDEAAAGRHFMAVLSHHIARSRSGK